MHNGNVYAAVRGFAECPAAPQTVCEVPDDPIILCRDTANCPIAQHEVVGVMTGWYVQLNAPARIKRVRMYTRKVWSSPPPGQLGTTQVQYYGGGQIETDPPVSYFLGINWVALYDISYPGPALNVSPAVSTSCTGTTALPCSTGLVPVAGGAPLPHWQGFGVQEFDIQLISPINVSRIEFDISSSAKVTGTNDAEVTATCGLVGQTLGGGPTGASCSMQLVPISIDKTAGYLELSERSCAPQGDGGLACDPATWNVTWPWFALDVYPKPGSLSALYGLITVLERFDIKTANGGANPVSQIRAGCPYTNPDAGVAGSPPFSYPLVSVNWEGGLYDSVNQPYAPYQASLTCTQQYLGGP